MRQQITEVGGLHHMLYTSRSSAPHLAGSEAVTTILKTAIPNNARLSVTGALLSCNGWFVQMLEGRRLDVGMVYQRICNDNRHLNVNLISCGPLGKRLFGQWSMCAAKLGERDDAIVRALESNGKFDASTLNRQTAITLLLNVARIQKPVEYID